MKSSEKWRYWGNPYQKVHVDEILSDLESLEAEVDNLRTEKQETEIVVEGIIKERDRAIADLAQANARLISLQAAATVLLEKCDEADASGDLPENIDGSVLDLIRSTLSAQPKGDVRERIAGILAGWFDIRTKCIELSLDDMKKAGATIAQGADSILESIIGNKE